MGAVRLKNGIDVIVGDGGEALEGPVLAHLAEPAHAPRLDGVEVRFGHELVEGGRLVDRVVGLVGLRRELVFLLDAPADVAEAGAGGAEVRGQEGGDLAADAGGELAAAAVGGDADLEGAVRVGGQDGE